MTFLISCYHHDNHDYHHFHDNNCHAQCAGSSVKQLDLPLGVQQGGGEGGYRAGDHQDHDEDGEDGDHHDHDEDEDDASNEKYDYGGGFGGWVAIKTC